MTHPSPGFTLACDVSYFQQPVDDSYNHPWLIIRANDGNFRDPKFALNRAWCLGAIARGKLTGYTAYGVYEPGVDLVAVWKSMIANPDPQLTVMFDVERWAGKISGDHSDDLNRQAEEAAAWLGDQRRVIAYANQGDYAALFPHPDAWIRHIVAGYSSVMPTHPNQIGWQYSDGETKWSVPDGYPRSSPPFGACDHDVFPGLTATQLADALGVGAPIQEDPIVALTKQNQDDFNTLMTAWAKTKEGKALLDVDRRGLATTLANLVNAYVTRKPHGQFDHTNLWSRITDPKKG